MMNAVELNDMELEYVEGGLNAYPSNRTLKELGLSDCVRSTGGFWDEYYDVKCKDGTWRNVGSSDMLKCVKELLGESDPRYKALYKACWNTDTSNMLII